MAVFEPNAKRKEGRLDGAGRLILSGVQAPSEHFILDKDLDVQFTYEYGGPGQKNVVISKGTIVGVKPEPEIDYETGKSKTVVTIAGKDGAVPIGFAPFNFAEHDDDFLNGNRPTVVTSQYIELPYFADPAKAASYKYGALVADGLKIGDRVTYSRDAATLGKFVKYDAAKHKPEEILGQVWAIDADPQTQGWLKWILFDEAALDEDSGAKPGQYEAPGKGGFPFDAEYRDGKIDVDGYLSQYTSNPTGVPGLLDGMQRGAVTRTKKAVALKTGATFAIELADTDVVEGSVKFYQAGTQTAFEPKTVTVDEKKGIVYYTVDAEATVDVEYKAETYGTPTHLDFDGVLGAVHILFH